MTLFQNYQRLLREASSPRQDKCFKTVRVQVTLKLPQFVHANALRQCEIDSIELGETLSRAAIAFYGTLWNKKINYYEYLQQRSVIQSKEGGTSCPPSQEVVY